MISYDQLIKFYNIVKKINIVKKKKKKIKIEANKMKETKNQKLEKK